MALNKRELTTVASTGVGRKDYSQNVEYSVEKELRSLQERFFYSYSFTALPALVFPNVYEATLQFLVDGVLLNEAPAQKPWMFYLIEATTDTNTLIVISLLKYRNYTDYLNGVIEDNLGTAFGFAEAKIDLTKGISTMAGSVYSVQFGVFGGVDFNIDLVIHGLIGGQEEL